MLTFILIILMVDGEIVVGAFSQVADSDDLALELEYGDASSIKGNALVVLLGLEAKKH